MVVLAQLETESSGKREACSWSIRDNYRILGNHYTHHSLNHMVVYLKKEKE